MRRFRPTLAPASVLWASRGAEGGVTSLAGALYYWARWTGVVGSPDEARRGRGTASPTRRGVQAE